MVISMDHGYERQRRVHSCSKIPMFNHISIDAMNFRGAIEPTCLLKPLSLKPWYVSRHGSSDIA